MTRALIRAALVIALVTAAVFLLIRLVPGDPVVMVLGEHATDEAVNQLREQLHLNDSLGQQFLIFLQNVFLHADTGNSIKYGVSCRSLILQYAPAVSYTHLDVYKRQPLTYCIVSIKLIHRSTN